MSFPDISMKSSVERTFRDNDSSLHIFYFPILPIKLLKLLVLVTAIRVKFISEFKGWQEAITILIVAPFWMVIITSSIHVNKQSSLNNYGHRHL